VSFHSRLLVLFRSNALHIRNVAYFLGTRAFAIVAFVLVVPLFFRHASEQQYGLAAIGFSLLTLATVLDVAFGYVLVQSLGRRFARSRALTADTVHGLSTFYFLLSSVVALCSLLVVFALHLSTAETLMYGSFVALLPALSVSGVVAAVFQSQNQLKPINLSRFGFELSKALALALSALVVGDISLIGPVLLLAAYARATLDARYLARHTGIRLSFRGIKLAARYWRLARHGLPSLYMVALMLPINIGDKLIIKNVFGADAVAHYSVAFDINTKAYLLISAVNTAMFAVVLHRFARKHSSFAPLAASLATVFFVTLMYYLPLMVLAPVLLTQWINPDFSVQATPLTRVMAFASILYLFGSVFENSLNAMGRNRRVLRVYLIGIIAYVIAVSFAIWQQSLIGFMYSYVALCAVLLLGFVIEYKKIKISI